MLLFFCHIAVICCQADSRKDMFILHTTALTCSFRHIVSMCSEILTSTFFFFFLFLLSSTTELHRLCVRGSSWFSRLRRTRNMWEQLRSPPRPVHDFLLAHMLLSIPLSDTILYDDSQVLVPDQVFRTLCFIGRIAPRKNQVI